MTEQEEIDARVNAFRTRYPEANIPNATVAQIQLMRAICQTDSARQAVVMHAMGFPLANAAGAAILTGILTAARYPEWAQLIHRRFASDPTYDASIRQLYAEVPLQGLVERDGYGEWEQGRGGEDEE